MNRYFERQQFFWRRQFQSFDSGSVRIKGKRTLYLLLWENFFSHYCNKCLRLASEKFVLASNSNLLSEHKQICGPKLGDFRTYPYPTTGGMSILIPPPYPKKLQNAHPSPHALRIPKSLTPPPLRNFPLFFRPFGILVRLFKTSNEWETCTFSPCKLMLFTIFGQTIKQLKFLNVSTPRFLLSVIFKLFTTK